MLLYIKGRYNIVSLIEWDIDLSAIYPLTSQLPFIVSIIQHQGCLYIYYVSVYIETYISYDDQMRVCVCVCVILKALKKGRDYVNIFVYCSEKSTYV